MGATDTKNLTIAEQDKTMSIQQIRDNLYFCTRTWYEQHLHLGDQVVVLAQSQR